MIKLSGIVTSTLIERDRTSDSACFYIRHVYISIVASAFSAIALVYVIVNHYRTLRQLHVVVVASAPRSRFQSTMLTSSIINLTFTLLAF